MKSAGCSRSWQVEAIVDGRLGASERASFERHVAGCRLCSRELNELRALASSAKSCPSLESSPLARRRLRQRVLRQANQLAITPPRKLRRTIGLAVVLANATALAATGVHLWAAPATSRRAVAGLVLPVASTHTERPRRAGTGLPSPSAADPPAPAPATTVVASATAAASRGQQASAARHAAPPSRLPAARSVAVRPGTPMTARPATPATTAAAPMPALRRGSEAGRAFARATSAFRAGDFAQAEQLFRAFERRHATDSRVEDAAILRALARQRRGDATGAKALMRDYLRRFPQALRRREATDSLARTAR